MGVEDYLITSTINAIMAQRLVRTLCPACKTAYKAEPGLLEELGWPVQEETTFWRATGCDRCLGTGYRGRTGIHELLQLDESIRALVMEHADAGVITARARESGMRTMFDDGLEKASHGLTSVEEVRRVTQM